MATNLKAWAKDLLSHCPGIPMPMVKDAVRESSRDFCGETYLWRYTLTAFDVVADTKDYTLTIPAAQYGEVVIIDKVKFKENGLDNDQYSDLPFTTEDDLEESPGGGWKYHTDANPSKWYPDEDALQLHLYPIPTSASTNGLLVKVILKPTEDCDTVPDFLWRDWRKALTAGAVSQLTGTQGLPWYNTDLSLYYQRKFDNYCSRGKNRKLTGATNKQLQVRVGYFA